MDNESKQFLEATDFLAGGFIDEKKNKSDRAHMANLTLNKTISNEYGKKKTFNVNETM